MTPAKLAVALITLLPAAALADEAPAPAAPAPAPLAPANEPVAPAAMLRESVDPGQLEDSNIDRGFLLPTAQTQPAGSVTFHDYQILLMGVTLGVTDDVQISAQTMIPVEAGPPLVTMFSAKYRFLRIGRLRAAAQGTVAILRIPDFDFNNMSDGADTRFAFVGTGVASYCLDEKCGSTVSASLTSGVVNGPNVDEAETTNRPIIYGASLVQRLNRRTKALVEVASALAREDGSWSHAEGALVSYGVRFFSREISGDVGFIKPLGLDDDDDAPPMGLPFINFTYRAL